MDFNTIIYFIIFILLILVVSKFMNTSASEHNHQSKPNSKIQSYPQNQCADERISKTEREFKNVVNFLQNEVSLRYGKNKNEKGYQQELDGRLSVLNERYGYDVHYEAVNGKHRVDFVVNRNIGIEMKVHRGGTQVQKELFSQITDYAQYCTKMIGLVVNVTNDDADVLRLEILDKLKYQHAITSKNYEIIVLNV
ncbi:GxxExxY protein [Methanolobus psychrotolerans]|uniref:GxxExxY protein n=1 Tax=Methanolobus psychrotolerans TaxID=1874706 RepID=UPI000B91C69A|nr:GxxExxY protein [Methanolobus psychrotolerans]